MTVAKPKLKPIIMEDTPYTVLVSCAAGGGIRSSSDDSLGTSVTGFVLRRTDFWGIPPWDKGKEAEVHPKTGEILEPEQPPENDQWSCLLFVPTEGEDDKLFKMVSDRTVCSIFKRTRHLATFNDACKTVRNNDSLDELATSINQYLKISEENLKRVYAHNLVPWTMQFIPKSAGANKNYSKLKWWWWEKMSERQKETQSRVVEFIKTWGVEPLELDYEPAPGLFNLSALTPAERREHRKSIAAAKTPTFPSQAEYSNNPRLIEAVVSE